MNWSRKVQLMIRWSILTAMLIAVFWTIWYLIADQVPVVESIKVTGSRTIELPFAMSRWWDILIGPIWSTIFILIVTNERNERQGENEPVSCGIILGSPSGIFLGLGLGDNPALGLFLVLCLFVNLSFSLSVRGGLVVSLIFSLVFSLFFSLSFGLVLGLYAGLVTGLFLSLVFCLVAVIAGVETFLANPKKMDACFRVK